MKRYILTMLCLGCFFATQTIGAPISETQKRVQFIFAYEMNYLSLGKSNNIPWDDLKAKGDINDLKGYLTIENNKKLCENIENNITLTSIEGSLIDGQTYTDFVDSCLKLDVFKDYFKKHEEERLKLRDRIAIDLERTVPREQKILSVTIKQASQKQIQEKIQEQLSMPIAMGVMAVFLIVLIFVTIVQSFRLRKSKIRIKELEDDRANLKKRNKGLEIELRAERNKKETSSSSQSTTSTQSAYAPSSTVSTSTASSDLSNITAPEQPVKSQEPMTVTPKQTSVAYKSTPASPKAAPVGPKQSAKEFYLGLPKGGCFAAVTESYIANKSLYRLVTMDGRTGEFEFYATPESIRIASQSQTMILEPACFIENEKPTFTSITTIKKGKATFDNGMWKIAEKSLIRFN